jgi:ABC-type transporter Mla maintaining outer membrane lipid asymmetry permease subunit MlaE
MAGPCSKPRALSSIFANPWLVLLSLAKSAVTGAAIGIIACHQGSSGEASARAISDAAITSVGAGLVAVFVIDVAAASHGVGVE